MIDRLFMKHLSKTGIKAYWIGQLLIDAVFIYYLFGIAGHSLNDDSARMQLILGVLGVAVVWGTICLLIWKKTEGPASDSETPSAT